MSKPNLLQFGSAIGIYRNPRIRDLHDLLKKSFPLKVDFADLAPLLFQACMAAAAENRIDGDFSGYSPERFYEIFVSNFLPVGSIKQASTIRDLFEKVGLFEGGKIRNWKRYNPHLADYPKILEARRKAGKLSAKKRELEAKAALKNGSHVPAETSPESSQKPLKNGSEKPSPSKQLWLIEKALEMATGKRKKELLQQKRELLGLPEPEAPAPPTAAPKPRKLNPAEADAGFLAAARETLRDTPDMLGPGMVKALLKAGDKLPADVAQRFSKLVGELGETRNPVPE